MIARLMRWICVVLLMGPAAVGHATETRLAAPEPTPDRPRQILLQLTNDEPRLINDLLFNVVNIQKFYGQDNVKIAVVGFGTGNRALYKDSSPVRARIESLLQYDVEFLACGNTMEATSRSRADIIEGVRVVTAGIPEIAERVLQGWIYIRP